MFSKLIELIGLTENGKTLAELSRLLGFGETNIDPLINFPIEYTTFQIPKKKNGLRTIEVPSKKLKSIQKKIVKKIFNKLYIYPAATAYQKRRSIVDNAKLHIKQAIIINIDLQDFFGSIHEKKIEQFFKQSGWSNKAAKYLTRLCVYNNHLPQGAPTSPALSNLVNFFLDYRLDKLTKKWGGIYSRYSDDLTFSFKNENSDLHKFRYMVKLIIKDEGYKIQFKKRVRIRRKHQQQIITGLVVNDKVNVPRSTRRRIRAIEHHLKSNLPATLTKMQLDGYKSFIKMVNKKI